MKSELKKTLIPLILMIILDLGGYYYVGGSENFGAGLNAYLGLIFVCGLLLGPYGAFGATVGNAICDAIRGYSIETMLISALVTFGSSYLSYMLWYEPFHKKSKIITPRLINTHYLFKFLFLLLLSGAIYAMLTKILFIITYPRITANEFIFYRYFLNYTNFGFIFGVIGIWISRKINFIHTPKLSNRKLNKKLYGIIGLLLIISIVTIIIVDLTSDIASHHILMFETMIILILLYSYFTKPMTSKIHQINFTSILEKMMDSFLIVTLIIVIVAMTISENSNFGYLLIQYIPVPNTDAFVILLIFADALSLFFFIPSLILLRYVEHKVVKPTISFSKIKDFIKKGEKIESHGLIKLYSDYIHEKNEIGLLARSYTDLIKHNNHYIENIHKIESEKERIKAELEIAEKIQKASWPTEKMDEEDLSVFGFSKPAKEVGGDFYDYYEIDDEHVAVVIGDASGKGVPAALLSTITQAIIKLILKTEKDPAKALYILNNQLCENNTEMMFITLWLGIFNKKTNKLKFSNAGHNPPIIYQNKEFKFLNTDTGIVLGIMENYEFVTEETDVAKGLVLYTDGITDANNHDEELYGEERLIEFLNSRKLDQKIISQLMNDIDKFSQNEEQFDDMTLLVLEKHD